MEQRESVYTIASTSFVGTTTTRHVTHCTEKADMCVRDLPSAPEFFREQIGSLLFGPVILILVVGVVILSLIENKQ